MKKDSPDSGDVHVPTAGGGNQKPKHKVKNLLVKEVSLCDYPANPGSQKVLFKRFDDIVEINTSGGMVGMTLEELKKALEDALAANAALQKTQETTAAELAKAAEKIEELEKAAKKPFPPAKNDGDAEDKKDGGDDEVAEMKKNFPAIAKRFEELEKTNKEDKAKLAEEIAKREATELAKRAETELPNLAGQSDVKGKLLKAAEALGEDAVKVLKAADAAMGENFQELGTAKAVAKTDAETELDNLAKAYAKEHSITLAKAYSHVMATEKGQKLYEASELAKRGQK